MSERVLNEKDSPDFAPNNEPTEIGTGIVGEPEVDGPGAEDQEEIAFMEPHWLHEDAGAPPMGNRLGTDHPTFEATTAKVRAAARWAIQATMKTKPIAEPDKVFCDALVENFVIGLNGYETPTGRPKK